MKAQVLHNYDPDMKQDIWVKEEEVPNPKIDKASDVIVKIGAAGVCRTDLHVIEGEWRHIQDPDDKLLPCVMGHENAGWIEDVGKDVEGFKKGDSEGIVNYCLSLKNIIFSVIFIEDIENENKIKISFRSQGSFSCNEFAKKHFNGGGHINAAGGTDVGPLEKTIIKFCERWFNACRVYSK